ncbi:MAG TPA: SRPBCC family protein [Pseudonocardia sp.]|jgi:uncharacterized membrane protein|uniref:SRPBCC family protein n=1 Tax=Pseudonocardia sp. TaxID=60912 RepID=UPI002EDB5DF9
MKYEVTEEIDVAASDIWAVLADVERWPDWCPTMTSVRRLDDGPFGVGSAAEIRQPKLPRAIWRVTEFEPGRRFEWTTTSLGVTTSGDHRIDPLPGGRGRITLTIKVTGALAPLLTVVVWPMTRRYVTLEARSLKRRCEARRAGPTTSS